jgi:hypothetical protein
MSISIIKTLAVCALLASVNQASAQEGFEFGLRYSFGKSALLNKTDKDAGPELDYASTTSYLFGGITAGYNFSKHTAVELGVLYSRQGQEYSGVNMETSNPAAYNNEISLQAFLNDKMIPGKYQAKAELNCIKFPILLKLTTDNTKPVYYTVSAGPQINLIKSVVFEVNNEDLLLPGLNIEPNDVYRKITLDAVLAVGAGLKLSTHFALSAQARLDYGLQDVENKDATFSFLGAPAGKYYADSRAATHNATAALVIGLNYKL